MRRCVSQLAYDLIPGYKILLIVLGNDYLPIANMRFTLPVSPSETNCECVKLRFCFVVFLVKMWLL